MDFIKEFEDGTSFSLFTKLLIKRINGALLSDEYLTPDELKTIKEKYYVDVKIIFDCPLCKKICLAELGQREFICDCDNSIDITKIKVQTRYSLNKKSLEEIISKLSRHLIVSKNNFHLFFNENTPITLSHSNDIVIHLSPYLTGGEIFKCLDNSYLDHFLINWNHLLNFLKNEEAILDDILRWRLEEINRQINWTKINEQDFQDLVYELIDNEKIFHKLIPGGKGPDQGKDLFGYSFITPMGKPEEVITLIQCKYTEGDTKYNTKDILEYTFKAKRHKCNYILFVTNGHLTGDTVTEIHSNAYQNETLRDIDFWDRNKLTLLLEKYPLTRLKYFYSK